MAPSKAPVSIPSHAIYVHPRGNDRRNGTINAPLKSIQEAADRAAALGVSNPTVVLRAGTHYLSDTVQLGPRHSHIHFTAYPGENAVMSGGVELKIASWKPYNVTPASNEWVVEDGQNAVYASTPTDPNFNYFGKTKDAPSCQTACQADAKCGIYTWHDANQGSYANMCVFRYDGSWSPKAQAGHTSGYLPSRIHAGRNTYVTNVKGQVPDVPGLQINGERATRARYPNLPGGIEVSPGYDGMISGNDASWTPPDLNKYGPVQFYTDNTTAHKRNDTTGTWFQEYMIGIKGLCSVCKSGRNV